MHPYAKCMVQYLLNVNHNKLFTKLQCDRVRGLYAIAFLVIAFHVMPRHLGDAGRHLLVYYDIIVLERSTHPVIYCLLNNLGTLPGTTEKKIP